MRYISTAYLQEDMVLGRPIYGSKFEVILAEGLTLGTPHIRRINDLGYAGVYIKDEISQDADIRDVVPPQLRIATIRAAKELLSEAEQNAGQRLTRRVNVATQQKIVMPIIEAIIDNRRRVVDLIDLKPFEDYNYYHAANVVILSILLGVEMGISGNELYELGMAALLHDVGNIFIPKNILQKPGKLTQEEYDVIKQHTEMGFQYLRDNYEISIEACIGALQHHENYDGTGYPGRLKKKKISIYGRIIAVTDVFDALVSRRPFRAPMFPPEAMEFIERNTGTMFDPDVVRELHRVISLYPTGTCVELSSGVRCLVVQNYVGSPARPRLRLLNTMSKTPLYIDLQNDPAFAHIQVTQIIEG